MSVDHWGEFLDSSETREDEKPRRRSALILSNARKRKLREVHTQNRILLNSLAKEKTITVKLDCPLITQTIEVMQQTEMLRSLIDTYSNEQGSTSDLVNPCEMIPEVDFPPENVVEFSIDEKLLKPIWYIPPLDTPFARGEPFKCPQLTLEICRAAIRKAVCGQLRIIGFADATDSSLVLFSDAVEEFIQNLILQVRSVHDNNPNLEKSTEITIPTLEKAYFDISNSSLLKLHNYYQRDIVGKNRAEIAIFKDVLEEYDKLMKESQSMQKEEFQEGEFLNVLEMPQANEVRSSVSSSAQDLVDGGTNILLGIFDNQTSQESEQNF